ncbi:MAG: hypothetical protein JXA93_13685 [Anaerolineae bacterium]|nr:hypothetical protein [Anaerolineae bacterium]
MTDIPITHLTLYKHGVGFFQRQAAVSGEQVELTFRVEEMNDVLKSLTAIDQGGGQVLSINYATPQSREERLAGSSVHLADDRSLRDLLVSLRGREVRLLLDQAETITGRLVGLDEVPERQPVSTSPVSILVKDTARVETVALSRVHGVEILDDRAAGDLRFFLDTALTQEDYRRVVVHLTPGEHNLAVSYVAPAPTWRVSYRLVAEAETRPRGTAGEGGRAYLLGWGIFDNRLEEDLEGISLALVAGMPISFVYDLYTPFTPSRPVVEEEARVAAAPVEFAEAEAPPALGAGMGMGAMMAGAAMRDTMAVMPAPAPAMAKMSMDAMQSAVQVTAKGQAMGELFQYKIGTPVTVERGHSAMVPIVSSRLGYRKDLLYNGAKMRAHPVATLRLKNETGITLERGPVTVVEDGEYVGEALVAFTPAGGEINVPYAVELGVEVTETDGSLREIRGVELKGAYLQFEEWHIVSRTYQLRNKTEGAETVLVEYPLPAGYDLFDTPQPAETAGADHRFQVKVPARDKATLKVQARKLMWRREEIQRQSYDALRNYLSKGLMNRGAYEKAAELLRLWEQIADAERRVQQVEQERQKVYQAQQQIQGNMGALGTAGKEGALRARYVEELEASQNRLKAIAEEEASIKQEIERLKAEVQAKLK